MAVFSPEARSASMETRVGVLVACGVISVAATFAQTEGSHQLPPDKVQIREVERDHVQEITTKTRASLKKYEKIFDCDIQSDMRPDPQGERRASTKEQNCAKYIAAVIGKNTYSWGPSQHKALVELWDNESVWSANADNPVSSAYGIPQAMTSSELHGPELKSKYGEGAFSFFKNPVTQIQWGLDYIHRRYGTPKAANKFWHGKCGGYYGCWY